MNWIISRLSYHGRIGRSDYWIGTVIFGILSRLTVNLAAVIAGSSSDPIGPAHWLVPLAALFWLWPESALLVKRGHDRGHQAAMTLVILATGVSLPMALWVTGQALMAVLVWAAVTLFFFFEYGLREGRRGANIYGERAQIGDGKPLTLS